MMFNYKNCTVILTQYTLQYVTIISCYLDNMKIKLSTIHRIINEELKKICEDNIDSMMNREAGFGDCGGSMGARGILPPDGLGDDIEQSEENNEHEQEKENPKAIAIRIAKRRT